MVPCACPAKGRGAAAERSWHHGESQAASVLVGACVARAMLFPCVGCGCMATMLWQRGPCQGCPWEVLSLQNVTVTTRAPRQWEEEDGTGRKTAQEDGVGYTSAPRGVPG